MEEHLTFSYGDSEDQFSEVVGERKLYLAVLTRAVADLMGDDIAEKADAVRWFLDESEVENEYTPRVTFKEVIDVFEFSSYRLKKLKMFVRQTQSNMNEKWANRFKFRLRVKTL